MKKVIMGIVGLCGFWVAYGMNQDQADCVSEKTQNSAIKMSRNKKDVPVEEVKRECYNPWVYYPLLDTPCGASRSTQLYSDGDAWRPQVIEYLNNVIQSHKLLSVSMCQE